MFFRQLDGLGDGLVDVPGSNETSTGICTNNRTARIRSTMNGQFCNAVRWDGTVPGGT